MASDGTHSHPPSLAWPTGLVLALLFAMAAATAPRVVRCASPVLAVTAGVQRVWLPKDVRRWSERGNDPWGRPWCVEFRYCYSAGPNGLDEGGGGDDVLPDHDLLRASSWSLVLVAWAREALLACSLLVLWASALRARVTGLLGVCRSAAIGSALAIGAWWAGDLQQIYWGRGEDLPLGFLVHRVGHSVHQALAPLGLSPIEAQCCLSAGAFFFFFCTDRYIVGRTIRNVSNMSTQSESSSDEVEVSPGALPRGSSSVPARQVRPGY